MCGLFGIVTGPSGVEAPGAAEALRRTLARAGLWLHHRGPDAYGVWTEGRVGLAHNRLSIRDLEGGAQPMVAADDAAVIVYNGELYNERELRAELLASGYRFRTDHSDTEVVLASYLVWGIEGFSRLEGMIAAAIWDRAARRVVLFRDRMGIKPLYYAPPRHPGDSFVFASEPKAIVGTGTRPAELREAGLCEVLALRAPLGPHTLFCGIEKVPPGHVVLADLEGRIMGPTKVVRDDAAAGPDSDLGPEDSRGERSRRRRLGGRTYVWSSERLARLRLVLAQSLDRELVSDVPVGVFLSGGVDSSLLCALLPRDAQLQAFCVTTEGAFDEGPFARLVASHLRLPLVEHQVVAGRFADRFDAWSQVNDDPSTDPSALALTMLCEAAVDGGMKVMLAGEGADELFGGYTAYLRYAAFLRVARWKGAGLVRRFGVPGPLGDYFARWPEVSYLGTGHLTTRALRRSLLDPEIRSSDEALDEALRVGARAEATGRGPLRNAMAMDQRVRLPDDLLMRTDRASMAHGLEVRVPYLSNDVVAFANALPDEACLDLWSRARKRGLVALARTLVPEAAVVRKKRGFDLPLRRFLREGLGDRSATYLRERAVPGLEYEGVGRLLADLEGGHVRRLEGAVFAWLVLEAWYRAFIRGEAVPHLPPRLERPHLARLRSDAGP